MSGRPVDQEWGDVEAAIGPAEARLGMAPLRCVLGRKESQGTLFLTDQRLIWRIADPRWPSGSGFELPLEDIDVVGKQQGIDDPGSFCVGVTLNGEFEGLLFFPHGAPRRTSVDSAERMSRRIRDARNRRLEALRSLENC